VAIHLFVEKNMTLIDADQHRIQLAMYCSRKAIALGFLASSN